MKNFFAIMLSLIFCFSFSACKSDDTDAKTKELVVEMFIQNGTYENGNYAFRKRTTLDNIATLYTFTYSPEYDLFLCSCLTTTYGNGYDIHDYGSVSFPWGEFKSGSFYSYHELDHTLNNSKVEFRFTMNTFNDDFSLGNDYEYSMDSNTFVNLKEKNDIDQYAKYGYEQLNLAIPYAQSILYSYLTDTTIW